MCRYYFSWLRVGHIEAWKKKKVLTAELRIRPRLPYSPSWILRIPTFESSAKMHFLALPPAHHPLGAFH